MQTRFRAAGFALALLLLLVSNNAVAQTTTSTLPEFNGTYHAQGEAYPLGAVLVGTFYFPAPGVYQAMISGTFGNSTVWNTSGLDLFLDGILVAQCTPYATCWSGVGPFAWSYTFAPAELGVFQDGVAQLYAVQTSEFVIRLGETSLTTSVVPEPGTVLLLGTGLFGVGLFGVHRRRRGLEGPGRLA